MRQLNSTSAGVPHQTPLRSSQRPQIPRLDFRGSTPKGMAGKGRGKGEGLSLIHI